MSDGAFRVVVHRGPMNLIDKVDDDWLKEKLPDDEIVIPPEHEFSVDDSDQQTTETQEQLEKKWLEIGMQEFQ
eukprot:m.377552 g.377552  ORF g.377552 m.377552 type:complete len:73 (+) comp28206_c0_seq4:63-281(+)